MASPYVLEPPTDGKILLTTTKGDLDVELWPKQAPRAVRNFVQLCLEGYYDGTIFHRVLKDIMIQGGDPTGTGMGGESIYGKPFKDEFHSRLRFSHRGLLAMASDGAHSNRSQFFITLDACEFYNRKYTIFGKVTGDTIYNVPNLAEGDLDEDDRPEIPPKILETEVLHNPFPDIVPRSTKKEREKAAAAEQAKKEKKRKRKGKKNLALLSFGEEQGEEEREIVPKKRKKNSKRMLHPTVAAAADESKEDGSNGDPTVDIDKTHVDGDVDMADAAATDGQRSVDSQSIRDKLRRKKVGPSKPSEVKKDAQSAPVPPLEDEDGNVDPKLASAKAEFEQLKKSFLADAQKKAKKLSEKRDKIEAKKKKSESGSGMSALERLNQKYKKRKFVRDKKEKDRVFGALERFRDELHTKAQTAKAPPKPKEVESDQTGIADVDDEDEDVGGDLVLVPGTLKFKRRPQDYGEAEDPHEYTSFDPKLHSDASSTSRKAVRRKTDKSNS